jgi:hypothetical protein
LLDAATVVAIVAPVVSLVSLAWGLTSQLLHERRQLEFEPKPSDQHVELADVEVVDLASKDEEATELDVSHPQVVGFDR